MTLRWGSKQAVTLGVLDLPSTHEQRGDDPLVQLCLGGDVAAWRELHRRYYSVARAFLRRLGVHERDAEDACQEVFIRLLRSLSSFRGECKLKTWIYKLCLTEAGRGRRRRRGWDLTQSGVAVEVTEPTVSSAQSELILRERVELVLNRMSVGDRAAFVLYELEGLSGREIAEVLACPLATVWRRLHYARRVFLDEFGVKGSR